MTVTAPAAEFLFIDSRVPDLQRIVDAAQKGVTVVVLDPARDGVQQIAQALEGHSGLASISIVSHGDQGVLLLGSGPLFSGNLAEHAADLQAIGAALGADGDILLYGCDVAAGEQGAAFVEALAQATGADVAASNDTTAGAALGGDWDLEISTGSIEAAPALSTANLADYEYSLLTQGVSTIGQLKAALATGATDGVADSITLLGNLTFASAADAITINVTDGQTTSIVGGGFTISGNNLARVVDVQGGKVAISNVAITNGLVTGAGGDVGASTAGAAGQDALGAGIRNAGTLTIANSTISGNKAAAGGGGGSQVGGGAGAGGGGGGFGSTPGAPGGANPGFYPGGAGSPGVGGTGGGYTTLGGRGGSSVGGVAGTYAGYTNGGNGATASNGTISIGGGGGGAGYDGAGGAGGKAAGAIYNTGTLTLTSSAITNNIAAGGGGGGGSYLGRGAGGNGGSAVGGIWNASGTVVMDTATNATLGGNVGAGGSGGAAVGSPTGTVGAGFSGSFQAAGATTIVGSAPTTTIASKSFSADTGTAGDFITNTAAQTISGTTSANLVAGESVQVSFNNGATWNNATSTVGSNAWSVSTTLAGSNTLQVKVTNSIGSGPVSSQAYVLDTAAPSVGGVNSSTANGTYKPGDVLSIQVNFSEAVTVAGTPQLTLETGTTDRVVNYASGSGSSTLNFLYTVQAGDRSADLDAIGTGALALNGGTIRDVAGNNANLTLATPGAANSLSANKNIVIDGVAPAVVVVTSATANGAYKAGDVISIQVNLGEAVVVTGTPQLTLETGTTDRVVNYASGSGTSTLIFAYTVQAGDSSFDLDYVGSTSLALNGGTIRDGAGNDAVLTLATPGLAGSLGAAKNIVIDTLAPSVTGVTSSSPSGVYTVGNVISIQVNFNDLVTVTGTPQLTLETGATDRVVNYASGSGSNILTFNYTVQAGDTASDLDYVSSAALALNGGTIRDAAGNNAVLTLAAPGAPTSLGANNNFILDTAPFVSSVGASTADGTYRAGDVIAIQVNYSSAVTVTGTPQLTLETGTVDRVVNYASGSGSSSLTFLYTVQAGDTSADLAYLGATALSLNGGTIRDAGGSNAKLTLPLPGLPNSLDANKAIVIDTTAPAVPGAPDLESASDSGASSTDNLTNVTRPTFSGTAEAGATVRLFDGVTLVGTGSADGAGNWGITTSSALAAGSHSLVVTATDAAGNGSGSSAALAIFVDTTAPSTIASSILLSDDSGAANDGVTNVAAQTLRGTTSVNLAAGETVEVSLDNGATWSPASSAVGTNTWSIAATLNANGLVQVRVVDAAGNASVVVGQGYVLDTAAPAAPGTPDLAGGSDSGASASDDLTSFATPTFTGTAEADATVTLFDTDGTTVLGSTAADGAGNWSITSTALAAGTHSVSVKATDLAGNVSPASGGLAITIDSAAPTLSAPDLAVASDSGTSGTDDITSVTTPILSGTAEAGATVTLYDTDGTTVLGTALATGGTWTITSSALGNGLHTLTARAADAAGNVSAASAGLAVTIDTAAPAAPATPDLAPASDSGGSSTDNVTSATTPTFTGTAEAGATVTLFDTDGTTVLGSTTAAAGNWSITSSALGAGAHTITARASDAAGNTSAASAGLAVTVDTAAPAAPSAPDLATASDSGAAGADNITSVATPTFTGTAEAGATVTLYDSDGTTVLGSATAAGGNWAITSSTLAAGTHTVTAKATDAAGNTSAASTALGVTIDTAAPAAPSAPDLATASDSGASGSDNVTSIASPTFTGTAEAGSTVTLFDTDGTTVLGTDTATGGNWSITSSALAAGAHTVTVKATDAAGNASGASAGLSFTIDSTAPAAPSAPDLAAGSDSGASSTDNITSATNPIFTGTAEAGATVTLFDTDGTTVLGTGTATGGNWSITSSALGAGAHTVTAKATDTAGNISVASAGLNVTIDTAAPAAPSAPDLAAGSDSGSSSTDNVTSATTPTFIGTAEAGATVTLFDSDGTTVLGTTTATGGNWAITSSVLAAGAHSLTARATDAAGNTSGASAGLNVTIDTAAPAAPSAPDLAAGSDSGASSTDNITSATTPTFSGTAEAGATVTLYDTDGTTVLGSTTATGGNWSITSSFLAAGAHTVTAKATDAAGNTSAASAGLALTIDTAAPAAPGAPDLAAASDSGASSTDNVTSSTTPTLTGTAEAGSTVALFDTDGTTVLGTATATGGSWAITSSLLAAGTHTLTTKATDAAGNTSAASTGLSVTVDPTAPAAPAAPDLAAGSDSGASSTDNVTSATTPTVTGTAEAGSTVTLFDSDGTTVLGTATATGGSWAITSSALADGTHTLTAQATDTAGNTSAGSAGLSVTVDTTAPAAPGMPDLAAASDSGASSTDNITSATTPTFTGTAEAGSTVTLFDTDGTTVLGTGTATGGNWAITSSTLAAGAHTVSAKATDAAGNTSVGSAGLALTVDTAAPAATSAPDLATASDSGSSATDNITSVSAPTFTGTAEAGSTVTLFDTDGTTVLGTTTATGGTWAITSSALAAGGHTVTARATDAAGHTSAASAGLNLTLDATAPVAPGAPDLVTASDSGSSSTDHVTSATTPTLAGTAEAGATVTLFDTDGTTVLGTTAADSGGAWSITSASLADGAHTLTATATDAAGNTGPASAALAITIDATAPVVTSVSTTAASRSYKAGEVLAIQLNFSEAVTVSGTPQLTLETGATDRVVDYVTGSGTGTLSFNYTVQAGDTSADLDYIATGALALNGGTIRDSAGNDAATALPAAGSATSLAGGHDLAIDGVAPVFLSASADGAALQLRYSKPLNASNLPSASAFTVRAGGSNIAVTSVAFDVAANVVLLTLGTAVSEGQALALGYTDPTSGDDANALQDLVGNDAASFGGVAVTNVTANQPAGAAAVAITSPDGAPPQMGQPLTVDPASISDPEGIQAGSLAFHWQRDGVGIPGAQGPSYQPTVGDVGAQLSVSISYVDGRNHAETLVVPVGQKVSDHDGVATATESLAPAFHAGGAQGDGNGDGIPDAFQVGVTSTSMPGAGALDTRFITVVADSLGGLVNNADAHIAVISDFAPGGITGDAPANARFDSSLGFSTEVGTPGLTELFSVFVDDSQDAHGFWVQDSAGQWRNATSEIETVDGKTRIDFMVEDGGAFDRDGVANGEIQLVGVIADAPVGIGGLVPVFVTGNSFWF